MELSRGSKCRYYEQLYETNLGWRWIPPRSKWRPSSGRVWTQRLTWKCWTGSPRNSTHAWAAMGGADGPRFIRIANQYLFEELGFRGNDTDYYDPANSCLDLVLDRRTGIPISLSVVYIEVARRLARPVWGIGLPGHFVVQYSDLEYSTYIDPFHRGKLLTEDDCAKLAREITGVDPTSEPSTLAPVGTRYILVRMLNNLRSAYFRVKQYGKAATILDLLVEAFPDNADYYKTRGVARLHLREFVARKARFGEISENLAERGRQSGNHRDNSKRSIAGLGDSIEGASQEPMNRRTE